MSIRMRTKVMVLAGIVLFIALSVVAFRLDGNEPAPTPRSTPAPKTTAFSKQQFSTTDPTSQWVVVNKKRPLQPATYTPTDLTIPNVPQRVPGSDSMQVRKMTATALETMFAAAKQDKINLLLSSGYRSYQYQVSVYGRNVSSQGQDGADNVSARPGHSEHQTGLAADIADTSGQCVVETCFANRPAGQWLAANAYKYGFIIRYGSGLTPITGYAYEPWHVRYVGTALAAEMRRTNQPTLERFFALGEAASY